MVQRLWLADEIKLSLWPLSGERMMNAVSKPEQWPETPASRGIAEALSRAQAEFAPIRRERMVTVTMKSGGKYTFAYAPLEVILRATLPALAKHELALTQAVVEDCVETTLMHSSGNLSNRVKIINQDGGAQAYGSALTYARRYGITLLLCVCADDDDDANAAEGNTAVDTPKDLHSPKGDLGKNVPLDKARKVAMEMMAIIDKPAADGDHDEMKKSLEALDFHERVLNPDEDLYVAVGDQLSASKRNVWKALISKARKAEEIDRQAAAGRKF